MVLKGPEDRGPGWPLAVSGSWSASQVGAGWCLRTRPPQPSRVAYNWPLYRHVILGLVEEPLECQSMCSVCSVIIYIRR